MLLGVNCCVFQSRENRCLRCDHKEALSKFTEASNNNYPAADLWLGVMHEEGNGVPKDKKIAKEFYRKVSSNIDWFSEEGQTGDSFAEFNLGYCYYHGYGVPKKGNFAVKCFSASAHKGNAVAEFYLGFCYYRGYGVSRDYRKEAVKCWQVSAVQGYPWYPLAEYYLGECYYLGRGVPKDDKKAVAHYQLAADKGNAAAQVKVGDYHYNYYQKHNIPEDAVKAVKYYQLAAEQGNAAGQKGLGDCYYYGRGVAQDDYEAAYYYQLASNQKIIYAETQIKKLNQKNPGIIAYANARIAFDKNDYQTAFQLLVQSLNQSPKSDLIISDCKPVWVLRAVVTMCAARTDVTVIMRPDEIDIQKENKKELFAAIKALSPEIGNPILLAAFKNEGVAGAIFHAPRYPWMPDLFGGGKCKTDSGALKDIAEELVARGLLVKKIGNQDSTIVAKNQALDKKEEVSSSIDSEETAEDREEIELVELPSITSTVSKGRN